MIFSRKAIEARRQKTETAWKSLLRSADVVLVHSGEPIARPGGWDQTYPFSPHPSYYWLTGRREPTEVVLYSPELGWVEFHRTKTLYDLIWDGGEVEAASEAQSRVDLEAFLMRHRFKRIYHLGQVPAPYQDAVTVIPGRLELDVALHRARRAKDDEELALIRQAAAIAVGGYAFVEKNIRAGVSEQDVAIGFEHVTRLAGSHRTPYGSIVGSGTNSAVLHATPSQRKIADDEMVLVDAGVDLYDYCVDITRCYPSSGKFSTQQQQIYSLVKKAQQEGIALMKPGVEWHAVHRKTAEVIAQGLLDLGIVRGQREDILDSGAISAFYPHGVGHLVGLLVRDTGTPENPSPEVYCGVRLRVDLPLAENYVITVEPGCYFHRRLLEADHVRKQYGEFMNWSEIERWKDLGGVRLEDDVRITKEGTENLTASVPKL